MIYCPACGTANRDGSRFCNECGQRLAPEEAPAICPRCGAANPPESAHCGGCGLDLKRSREEAEPGTGTGANAPAETPTPPESAAVDGGGLPPWLDSIESPDEQPAPDQLPDEAPSEQAAPLSGEWTADALPIEPIVGVPYRAHERPEPPPSAEQDWAVELFTNATAEEVHASPQEVPPPRRTSRWAAGWQLLIAFALLFALLVPMIWPVGPFNVVASIPPSVAEAADTIEALPPGAVVLVVFDYDAGSAGELQPIAQAYLQQLLGHGARILAVSTLPEGAALAEMALEQVLPAFPAARYGETVLNLGYVAGGEAAVRALAANVWATVPADYRSGMPLGGFPILEGLTGVRDLPLIVVLGRDLVAVQRWIEQASTPYGTPLVAGVPALIEPIVGPYHTTGQLRGVVAGLGGAAAYERLESRVGPAGRQLGALRTGIWVTAGLLVGVNLVALLFSLRRRPKS